MSPTLQEAHERHKRFHQSIARRANIVRQDSSPVAKETVIGKEVEPLEPIEVTEVDNVLSKYKKSQTMLRPIVEVEEEPIGVQGVPISLIIDALCAHFGLTKLQMMSERRDAIVVRARQVGFWLCKQLTTRSLPYIGRRFGGRDHTTVLFGIRRVSVKLENDPDLREEVFMLRDKLAA